MDPTLPVSVVLPAYNAEHTVAAAVNSILGQTFHDFEVVVVDDGSTDQTAAVLQELARRDARVRVLRTPHAGIATALNTGIQAARGRLIARMDADDAAHPARIERQVALLRERPEIGLVACRVRFGGNPGAARGLAEYIRWNNRLIQPDEIALNRFIESPVIHPTVLFRRSLIRRFGGYRDGDFPEDYELWLRWLEAGVLFAKLPEELLVWNDSGTRLTRTDPRYAGHAIAACKARHLARWLARHNPRRPEIIVWGAGRLTRKRAELLTLHGVRIIAYVDIDPRKTGKRIHGRPVLTPDQLPEPGRCFVVSYVGVRNAREQIRAQLRGRGWIEGRHFILAA